MSLAARKVTGKRSAAGVDRQSSEAFDRHLVAETRVLSEQLQRQTYRPQAVRRVHVPKQGKTNEMRPLGIPIIRDRVVQKAVLNVIDSIPKDRLLKLVQEHISDSRMPTLIK